MYHNEIFKNIIKYSKDNDLKPDVLYFFIIEKSTNQLTCIEDKSLTMEEFSEFLDIKGMEEHLLSTLKLNNLPHNKVKYTRQDDSNILIVPFSFQNANSIKTSFIECFFAFEVKSLNVKVDTNDNFFLPPERKNYD